MLVNFFTSVSLDPPLKSTAFNDISSTWKHLRAARELGITIMGEPTETSRRGWAVQCRNG